MIDIALIRDPESLKLVIESQRKRGAPPELVESVKAMDEQWRKGGVGRFEGHICRGIASDCMDCEFWTAMRCWIIGNELERSRFRSTLAFARMKAAFSLPCLSPAIRRVTTFFE